MDLDPNVRQKLLKESQAPFLGVRRLLWGVLFGSAMIGLLIMLIRLISGNIVPLSDIGVQSFALLLFGGLIIIDRNKTN